MFSSEASLSLPVPHPALAATHSSPRSPPLHLRPGEWVEVRGEAEILATLDDRGTLDALPFMPEMRPFCGRRFRVLTRADRTVAEVIRFRRMRDTVHLEEARCGGEAHEGCCRGCLLFWKEAWLRRVAQSEQAMPSPGLSPGGALKTRDGDRYFCQATEIKNATRHLPAREVRGYVDALRGEGLRPIELLHALAIFAYDNLAGRLGWNEWNHIAGPCTDTPATSLHLQPGDRVRVKSLLEIVATLDAMGWNRGMEFSREMRPYCGRECTVLRRVDRMIRDHTATMVRLRNTVILDGLTYKALNRLACPRGEYMFWRECWLERVG